MENIELVRWEKTSKVIQINSVLFPKILIYRSTVGNVLIYYYGSVAMTLNYDNYAVALQSR